MTENQGGSTKQRWMKLALSVPGDLLDAMSNFMIEVGAQGVYEEALEPWAANDFPELKAEDVLYAYLPFDTRLEDRLSRLQVFIEDLATLFPDLAHITYRQEAIEDPDWGEQWKKYFKPLRVSRAIVVKPTWERYTPEGGDTGIDIDPGMAFGTGQHASTRMCLEALEDVISTDRTVKAWKVLDVGTGTGILGIACAKLGAARVLCLDIDKKAIGIARENIRINEVNDRVKASSCDVNALEEDFDLIVANLTEKILVKLKPALVRLLRPGGYLIVSGIVIDNRSMIEESFLVEPLVTYRSLAEKEWLCYVLQKRSENR